METTSIITRVRQAPWIGMGTSGSWDNVSEALYDSGLNYDVSQSPAYDKFGHEIPNVRVNHRSDTDQQVGVISNRYGIVQNVDAFSLLDPFCASGGVIEHAGMTDAGMCFMVMRMPAMAFGFANDDFELYVCAMNSFNGRFPLALIVTPVRVVCQNMFRKLMKRGDAVLVIKHGRFATNRIMSATAATVALTDYTVEFVGTMRDDYLEYRTPSDQDAFIERLFPMVPETTEHPRAKQTNEKVKEQRAEFYNSYLLAPDNQKYVGTRLGLLNAYYDYVTHNVPMRAGANHDETRLNGLLLGSGVDTKLIASA